MDFVLGVVVGCALGAIASDEIKALYARVRGLWQKK